MRREERVIIESLEPKGRGVARLAGRTLFVAGALPGEQVDVRVSSGRRDWAVAELVRIHKASPQRRHPFCAHFGLCGGCRWQHLSYEDQLNYKRQLVADLMRRIGGFTELEVPRPIASADTVYYRNKLEFSFSHRRWLAASEIENAASRDVTIDEWRGLGLHASGAFDRVVDIEHCWLQPDPSNQIRLCARDAARRWGYSFFDIRRGTGQLRNLILRNNLDGKFMVLLVLGRDEPAVADRLLSALQERFPQIISLCWIVNDGANDSIEHCRVRHWAGTPFIVERCGHIQLQIHPKSFYQVNSQLAAHFYSLIREWAELDGSQLLFDLYCGIGGIALFVADGCRAVWGVDSLPEAIEAARVNAELNGIANTRFAVGEMRHLLAEAPFQADVVVLDPPRAGLHPAVVTELLRVAPPQIIYASCNPATQARDARLLAERYRLHALQPVDMFPQTYHIENIIDLRRR